MGNPVVRWQVVTPCPEEVGRFYVETFGWRVDRDNPLGVREVGTGSPAGIGGTIWPAPPEVPSFVQLFVEVDDVEATIARVTGRGGSVLVPRSALPEGDVMAVVRDPFGMSIGLVEARPAPPAAR
jgi:predicted enzyme related to lactoylglutathione lyase